MNLPHQKPIKFAQKLMKKDANTASVLCLFPEEPTLAMYYEAAAQSSVCFSNETYQTGVVVSVKNLKLLKKSSSLDVLVELQQEACMGRLSEVSFQIKEKEFLIAQGTVTMMLHKENE